MTRKSQLGSGLVQALEHAYQAVADVHGLPDVIFITGAGLEGRSPKWGHYWHDRWRDADDGAIPEVFIAGEQMANGAEATFKTLLHEASKTGRYHNRKFVKLATELGLAWPEGEPPSKTLGFSAVVLTDATKARWAEVIEALGVALAAHLPPRVTVAAATANRNGLKLTCSCERIIRASASTADEGPLLCGLCGDQFLEAP
jgi:hypothetical protein